MSNMDHDEAFQPMTQDQITELQDAEFTRLVSLNRELILALIDLKGRMGPPEWKELKGATIDILISIELGGIAPLNDPEFGVNIG